MNHQRTTVEPATQRSAQGAVVWLVGPPAVGKTTIARHIVEHLTHEAVPTLWLDSDVLRPWLTPRPGYTEDERDRLYGAIGHLAVLGAAGGAVVVVSATAHRRSWRDAVRAQVRHMCEVWLVCDAAVLSARDPKGLYRLARSGETGQLPGVHIPMEAPAAPEITADTGISSATQVALRVATWLEYRQCRSFAER